MNTQTLTFATGLGGWIALVASTALAQADTSPLRANPFDRPDFVLNLGQAEAPQLLQPPVELELRATMITSNNALANINGELLRMGQRIEGYRVVWITEGRAVLRNDSGDLVLDVYESQRGSEEESSRD